MNIRKTKRWYVFVVKSGEVFLASPSDWSLKRDPRTVDQLTKDASDKGFDVIFCDQFSPGVAYRMFEIFEGRIKYLLRDPKAEMDIVNSILTWEKEENEVRN